MRKLVFGHAVWKLIPALFIALLALSANANAGPDFDYLKANAKKDGVATTKTGLQYRVLRKGTGKAPRQRTMLRSITAARSSMARSSIAPMIVASLRSFR